MGFSRLFMTLLVVLALPCARAAQEEVILLHGLCRTSRSMATMEKALTEAGYKVRNVPYASRSATIEQLSESVVGRAVEECQADGAARIHFVTHSFGGILVRNYLKQHTVPSLGRVVMLAPPNQGSELVDKLGNTWAFKKICGVAGQELGTREDSLCSKLGPANFEFGVIAGNRSVYWIDSMLIPGSDDGRVSVERTRLEGMSDHIVIHTSHPFIVRNRLAIQQSIHFLQAGKFKKSESTQVAAY